MCLSEETLKAVGPFYLVSMPGEVQDPAQGVNRQIPCRGLHTSLNHKDGLFGVYIIHNNYQVYVVPHSSPEVPAQFPIL